MPRPQTDLVTLFRKVSRALDRLGVVYAFIGAVAVNAWGRVRATMDLDLEMAIEEGTLGKLHESFKRIGLTLCGSVGPANSADPLPDNLAYRTESGIRVDILITKTPFQREALARRVQAKAFGQNTWVVTPEDLVVYKIIAGRPRDLDDIEDILEARGAAGLPVDFTYIERWVRAWGMGKRLAPFLRRFRL